MQFLVVLGVLVGLAVAYPHSGQRMKRGSNGDQNPKVWDALALLRGKELTVDQIQELYPNVVPGTDFPILAAIPDGRNIDCASFKQPGLYADSSDKGRCQVFDRCDINGNLTSYLCPNMTLFNQITLICDWWYNVDCSKSSQFQDYSNSRLYVEGNVLLDDQLTLSSDAAGGGSSADSSASAKVSGKASSSSGASGAKKGAAKKKSAAAAKPAAAKTTTAAAETTTAAAAADADAATTAAASDDSVTASGSASA